MNMNLFGDLFETQSVLKKWDVLYYWDHGVLRKRTIANVRWVSTGDMSWKIFNEYRDALHRSQLPHCVYIVTFFGSDKEIMMVRTHIKGQLSTGTMYYWDSIDEWAVHQELRELKMNEKIDRALAEIAYARKQLDSISKKFRKLRKTVIRRH